MTHWTYSSEPEPTWPIELDHLIPTRPKLSILFDHYLGKIWMCLNSLTSETINIMFKFKSFLYCALFFIMVLCFALIPVTFQIILVKHGVWWESEKFMWQDRKGSWWEAYKVILFAWALCRFYFMINVWVTSLI